MHQEENSEPDVVKTAPEWSKVSKRIKNRTHFYWLAGGLFAVLLVFMLSSKRSQSIQKPAQSPNNSDYHTSLNENLARLKAMTAEKNSTIVLDSKNQPLISPLPPPVSKEYLARQNAPTTMYAGSVIEATHAGTESHVQEATFTGESDEVRTAAVEAKTLSHPEFTIVSGEFLQAVLETAINSDLPGKVRAIVSKPVYAYIGEHILIPSGSRLIGSYSSAVIQGQNRVMVVWNRAILPDGVIVQFDSPSTDSLGRAGQGDDSINTHFFARFSQSALLSLIGAGTATAGVNNQEQYNSAAQYRMAIAQSFQQSAQQSVQGTLAMKPTLHIYQGTAINVFVAQDLSFYQVLKNTVASLRSLPSFIERA